MADGWYFKKTGELKDNTSTVDPSLLYLLGDTIQWEVAILLPESIYDETIKHVYFTASDGGVYDISLPTFVAGMEYQKTL